MNISLKSIRVLVIAITIAIANTKLTHTSKFYQSRRILLKEHEKMK